MGLRVLWRFAQYGSELLDCFAPELQLKTDCSQVVSRVNLVRPELQRYLILADRFS